MKKVILVVTLVVITALPITIHANSATEGLENQIQTKRQHIEQLKEEQNRYKEGISRKRKERVTLSNQLSILNDQEATTRLEIEEIETDIEATNLEITKTIQDIKNKEEEIATGKDQLAAAVRWLARSQDRSLAEIFFTQDSFADFYKEVRNLQNIQLATTSLVDDVTAAKLALGQEKELLEEKEGKLIVTMNNLTDQKLELEERQDTKAYLISRTRSSERKYAALLKEAKREQAEADAEIVRLEKEVRERLKNQGLEVDGKAPIFIWPVPKNRITTTFRDPDYPFRHLFEHNAIDIRAAQGTEIRAPAAGYIARVRTGKPNRYWFVMIIHEGGLATVYGHVSKVLKSQDSYVNQGEVIALTGGLPGTPGAGPFSTGPHLHFEVRENGVPVNPLNYLP